MFDNKLAHNRNFQFLPPQNENGSAYGAYEDLRSTTRETFADIKNHLGITIMKPYEPLEQTDTAKGTVTKLDIVDAGEFYDEDDEEKPTKHVFYAGKIMFDTMNIPSFVNFFTIIFD